MRHFEARLVATGPDEVLGLVRDISERKRNEEQIRRTRRKIADPTEIGPDAVFAVGEVVRIKPRIAKKIRAILSDPSSLPRGALFTVVSVGEDGTRMIESHDLDVVARVRVSHLRPLPITTRR